MQHHNFLKSLPPLYIYSCLDFLQLPSGETSLSEVIVLITLLGIRIPTLYQYSHTLKRQTLWELGYSVFPKVYFERRSVTVHRSRQDFVLGGQHLFHTCYLFFARAYWKNRCFPAIESPRSSSRKDDENPQWDVLSFYGPILSQSKSIRVEVLRLHSCEWP